MEYTVAVLDNLKHIGDPVADDIVADLANTGRLGEVNRLLHQLQSNDQEIPADLPESLRAFIEDARRAPLWADQKRLTRVYEFFQDDGIHLGMAMALGSMAMAYAMPLGAKMMSLTHRLHYPERRMSNTAQFVFDMMKPDPFGPNSRFVISLVKVRLIHATIRYHLRTAGVWDEARDGPPASQEHLLIVWLALSVQVLSFMERLRISVTPQESEDYLHAWRVAGVMLGIQADAMPTTVVEGQQLLATILQRSAGPSPEGVELTKSLLDLYAYSVPGKIFDGIVPAYLRHLIGDEVADWLGVPHSRVMGRVVRGYVAVVGALEALEDRSPLVQRSIDRFFQLVVAVELRVLTRGHYVQLDLPEQISRRV